MSGFAGLMVHEVDLIDPGTTTTPYGDVVADWDNTTRSTEKGWFTRTATEEMAQGREAITDLFELSLPATSAITDAMRVERLGVVYEVRGSIDRASTPTGTHHLIARLRKVRG